MKQTSRRGRVQSQGRAHVLAVILANHSGYLVASMQSFYIDQDLEIQLAERIVEMGSNPRGRPNGLAYRLNHSAILVAVQSFLYDHVNEFDILSGKNETDGMGFNPRAEPNGLAVHALATLQPRRFCT
ncbi:hypothetical protein AVEN_264637-1 [Araneus ventricosus]|uniref:Uncharacterized protein n=1 Tax=Araneus ventricosus TaxID=182803 RepID=A0A4Y2T4I4_ARAVE|nr:hypothetical protein AVEN_264637-1 [Araneus ventricosus]